jgi:hypothetical protein
VAAWQPKAQINSTPRCNNLGIFIRRTPRKMQVIWAPTAKWSGIRRSAKKWARRSVLDSSRMDCNYAVVWRTSRHVKQLVSGASTATLMNICKSTANKLSIAGTRRFVTCYFITLLSELKCASLCNAVLVNSSNW